MLSILKLDEMLSMGKMEQIQTELFSRGLKFVEYDEPVNEWSILTRIFSDSGEVESKLEKRLNDVRQMPEGNRSLWLRKKSLLEMGRLRNL